MKTDYDLLIIGGGINGTAIARDAAGRGLSVMLCERDDLANHTSSSSTKLIHGGLRYLEHFEFKLVREALIERERLLRAAPHIIWPMRFVLPYDKGLRPAWMLRMGLFLYDSLGGRELLPGTRTISLKSAPHKGVLEPRLTKGFEYSDCWVEDARLVVLNAVDAKARGAVISTRTEVLDLTPLTEGYEATIKDKDGTRKVTAHAIINSAGPWVDEILGRLNKSENGERKNDKGLRLVKGSHIVTRRLFKGDHSYIFQNADNRIIFAIPYEGDYTLIGTTDVPFDHAPGPVKISPEETKYLCDAANEYFQDDISPDDVLWSYSGVRPLYDDKSENASAVTRDYVLDIDEFTEGAPLDIPQADFDSFYRACELRYPEVDSGVLHRLARSYGTRISLVLGSSGSLGKMFGAGLSESEARYLAGHEFVTRADDIMWRRSKLGLHMSKAERAAFTDWFDATLAR